MNQQRRLPSLDRLSVPTAVIVLAYTLARLIDIPGRVFSATLFGSPLGFELTGRGLMLLLVAALISTGSDTLIRSHPYHAGRGARRTTTVHWILPGATALVLGAALNQAPAGPAWWLGLGVSAVALLVVQVAEFLTVDPEDPARDTALIILAVLSYSLALVLFWLLRNLNARAAISASVAGAVAAALAWRLFAFRAVALRRAALHSALVGALVAEVTWAVNYWRVTALAAGLVTMIAFYICVGLIRENMAGRLTRRVWLEYGIVGGSGLVLAVVFALAWAHP